MASIVNLDTIVQQAPHQQQLIHVRQELTTTELISMMLSIVSLAREDTLVYLPLQVIMVVWLLVLLDSFVSWVQLQAQQLFSVQQEHTHRIQKQCRSRIAYLVLLATFAYNPLRQRKQFALKDTTALLVRNMELSTLASKEPTALKLG